jgi:hypothetical protein
VTTGYPKSPTFISIFLGIIACIAALFFIGNLGNAAKWAGNAFLFIPSKLGLIQNVRPNEVIPVDFSTNPTSVYFPKAGAYDLYTDNLDLLTITNALNENERAWLVVTPADGQETPQVLFFKRGLYPYDTPFAKGRPIYYLYIDQPGYYTVTHPTRQDTVFFVPDYNTFNEGKLIAIFAVEICLILIPTGTIVYRRWERRTAPARQRRKQRQDEVEDFWQKQRAKRSAANSKKDEENPDPKKPA